jgi:hypothetical protein
MCDILGKVRKQSQTVSRKFTNLGKPFNIIIEFLFQNRVKTYSLLNQGICHYHWYYNYNSICFKFKLVQILNKYHQSTISFKYL